MRYGCAAFSIALLLVLFVPSARAAEDGTETVVVSGIGTNEESALRQAHRNAVRMVVGNLILAETMVENEALIHDRIISHSDGFIKSSRPVGSARNIGDGLIEVTVSATVSKRKLGDRLLAENITTTRVNIGALVVQQETTQERDRSLVGVIRTLMQETLPSFVSVRAGEPRRSGKEGEILVPVTLEINQEKYVQFCRKFSDTLRTAGQQPVDRTVDISIFNKANDIFIREVIPFDESRPETVNTLWVVEQIMPDAKKARVKAFLLPAEVIEAFADSIKWYSFTVSLLDSDGREISKRRFSIENDTKDYYKNRHRQHEHIVPGSPFELHAEHGGLVNITYPVFGVNQRIKYDRHEKPGRIAVIVPRLNCRFRHTWKKGEVDLGTADGNKLSYDIPFIVSEDELKQIESVRCSVVEVDR